MMKTYPPQAETWERGKEGVSECVCVSVCVCVCVFVHARVCVHVLSCTSTVPLSNWIISTSNLSSKTCRAAAPTSFE